MKQDDRTRDYNRRLKTGGPQADKQGGQQGGQQRRFKPEGRPSGVQARMVALDLLGTVLIKQTPLDERLDQDNAFAKLSPRDRAFAYNLVLVVLRHCGTLDALLDQCLDRPKDLREHDLRQLLRLGAAQLLYLETPPHAAIDTCLHVADARRLTRAKGLINAVLRKVSRDGKDILARLDQPDLDTPEWLWQGWEEHYGVDRAAAIATAHKVEPGLDISLKDPTTLEHWAEELEATILPNGSLRRPTGGAIDKLPGYDAGAWWVQDAAASLPARMFGTDLSGKKIGDLCAAPGGKTAQLAAAGADVIALDRSAERLERLYENVKRMGFDNVKTITANAKHWQPETLLDGVLLDAPCSATGTIRRHPDVPWLKTPDDVDSLAEQQAELLAQAIDMVKPGGTLVYCTCSLEPMEGEAQIERLLSLGAPIKTSPISADELGIDPSMITDEGWLRVLPSHWAEHGGIDGFFAARLERLPD
jgi:16S rRNA (cytosine967-C5)-methyltransferase